MMQSAQAPRAQTRNLEQEDGRGRGKEEQGEQFTFLAKKVFYGLLSDEIGDTDESEELA